MRKLMLLPLLQGAFSVGGVAQDSGGIMTAGDALTQETCNDLVNDLVPAIERYTRMKFRRKVPIFVEPKSRWENRLKQGGFGGSMARTGLAYYNIIANSITVVPWTMGGYLGGNPRKKARIEWLGQLGPILIHELSHAIHYQNFYAPLGGARQATTRTGENSLSEDELDEGTVGFLLSEGFAELVSVRTARPEARMHLIRRPHRDISSVLHYMRHYRPDDKIVYRIKLSASGYQDGMNLLHHLTFGVGPLGPRAVLYRPPPRVLLFQPKLLSTVKLDDPPNPDAVFDYLAPEMPKGSEVMLTVNPGANRFFKRAHVPAGGRRARGCLIGYYADVDSKTYGYSRYAFYVADPDGGGDWSKEQAESLKKLHPSGVKEKTLRLPFLNAKAAVITVTLDDGSRYVRAEYGGLVTLAHEAKPSATLEERCVAALRVLYIRKPTPNLYDAAKAKAIKEWEKLKAAGG